MKVKLVRGAQLRRRLAVAAAATVSLSMAYVGAEVTGPSASEAATLTGAPGTSQGTGRDAVTVEDLFGSPDTDPAGDPAVDPGSWETGFLALTLALGSDVFYALDYAGQDFSVAAVNEEARLVPGVSSFWFTEVSEDRQRWCISDGEGGTMTLNRKGAFTFVDGPCTYNEVNGDAAIALYLDETSGAAQFVPIDERTPSQDVAAQATAALTVELIEDPIDP